MKRILQRRKRNTVTSKRLNLSVQYACDQTGLPLRAQVRAWARAAWNFNGARGGQITVRFVDAQEGRSLNRDYRGKDYATNVLSFPYGIEPVICGDLVICAPIVDREAAERDRSPAAHYAHLIVHGLLHLQGYDHETGRQEARTMEAHECAILAALGYADPY
jgi:probable rRNA maturation factor